MIKFKHCKECKQDKEETAFKFDKRWQKYGGKQCIICVNKKAQTNKRIKSKTPEARARRQAYLSQPEVRAKVNEQAKERVKKNPARYKLISKRHHDKHKDKLNEATRQWRINNPGKSTFYSNKRGQLVRNATIDKSPEVLDLINGFYRCTKFLKENFNNVCEVDHIILLQHPDVCGLNVPWNLQIIKKNLNASKSNKWDGTYNNESWKDYCG